MYDSLVVLLFSFVSINNASCVREGSQANNVCTDGKNQVKTSDAYKSLCAEAP